MWLSVLTDSVAFTTQFFLNTLVSKSKTRSDLMGDKYKIISHAGKFSEPND